MGDKKPVNDDLATRGRENAARTTLSGETRAVTPTVSIDGLACSIGGRAVLENVRLTVDHGESVALVGPSGSGKSTLLMCVLGMIKPRAGRVVVNGIDVVRLRRRALARYRRENIGIVFQFGELLPELTPMENVALAALLAGVGRRPAYRRSRELLGELGVPATGTPTAHLSGGERQRAAVARALVTEPSVLLADEPTGALDHANRDAVAEMLFALPRRRGCALLVVTHDEAVAGRADRRVALRDGVIVSAPEGPEGPEGPGERGRAREPGEPRECEEWARRSG
ncbi:lipoprotein-releasing system ATP-binding protein LolD [Streptosporangium violaceochromogenes]|nr:lipoprotein-releasing system ATP-binding protein LolD [Streptosporangium violaceochromogenes]